MLVGGVGVGKKAQRSGVGAMHGTGGAKKGEGDVCGRCTRAVTEGNTCLVETQAQARRGARGRERGEQGRHGKGNASREGGIGVG